MVGVYGGTFNPIHNGHLMLAEHIRDEFQLSGVIFIPAHIPPHKAGETILSAKDRLQMLRLAIQDNPLFQLDELELARTGYSYTVDTLSHLTTDGHERIAMIVGADSLIQMHCWREPERLLKMADIIVARRPEISESILLEACHHLETTFSARIYLSSATAMPISSTEIRQRAASGKTVRYHVPEAVFRYIHENNLYQRVQGEDA